MWQAGRTLQCGWSAIGLSCRLMLERLLRLVKCSTSCRIASRFSASLSTDNCTSFEMPCGMCAIIFPHKFSLSRFVSWPRLAICRKGSGQRLKLDANAKRWAYLLDTVFCEVERAQLFQVPQILNLADGILAEVELAQVQQAIQVLNAPGSAQDAE